MKGIAALAALAALGTSGPGSLDASFGVGGRVATTVGPSAYPNAVAVLPDGEVAAAGTATVDGEQHFALVRYHHDGSVATITTAGAGAANGVAAAAGGSVVAVGEAGGRFAVATYTQNGVRRITTRIGTAAAAYAVAVVPDGRVVVAGVADGAFALARYRGDGSLDTAFGGGGIVVTRLTAPAGASSVALQPDGKIVTAGWSGTRFAVVRYLSSGSLDAGFGRGGVATVALGESDSADDVLVQPDGRIVVGGGSFRVGVDRFALVRLNADGGLDRSFGAGGKVATPIGSGNIAAPIALALLPSGKIVAAGSSEANWKVSFALARYDRHGSLDHSFGDSGGVVTTAFDVDRAFARAAALDADGKVVVAGYADAAGSYRFALARYVVVGCVVPDVRRSRVGEARREIRHAECSVGRVSYARSRVARGRVVREHPSVGARLSPGAAVHLVVSRGRRR